MQLKTIKNQNFKGKRVLLRVDFNVPLNDFGRVADDTRIREALPTIKYLENQGGRIILVAHFGRPKGKVNEKMRLEPVARYLSRLINHDILILREAVGENVARRVRHMEDGDIAMLENIRFYEEEEKNDPGFARQLASLAEVYINDAFGTAHRAHASTEGVAHLLPSYAGFLMEKEVEFLSGILEKPEHPFYCFLGGAKISTKLGLIKNLTERADKLFLGGALVHTILMAKGLKIGKSLVEKDMVNEAKDLLKYESSGKLILPKDGIVCTDPEGKKFARLTDFSDVKNDEAIFDIGLKTMEFYTNEVQNARLIVWNGPMGMFETPAFSDGTTRLAKAIASQKSHAKTIIGGGETLEIVKRLGLEKRFSFVSTGGGAMLEFLAGDKLPGIEILKA